MMIRLCSRDPMLKKELRATRPPRSQSLADNSHEVLRPFREVALMWPVQRWPCQNDRRARRRCILSANAPLTQAPGSSLAPRPKQLREVKRESRIEADDLSALLPRAEVLSEKQFRH